MANTTKSLILPLCTRCLRPTRLSRPPHLPNPRPSHLRPISTYGYTQAKALVYSQHGNPSDVLSLHTHSLPPPHSNLLTLRTLCAPLNPADINQIQGTYASSPPFTTSLGTTSPSAVPGNEGVFEVLSTGSGVKGLKGGDWVIPRRTGMGCWRTHVLVGEGDVIKIERGGGKDGGDGGGGEKQVTAKQAGSVSVNPVTAWRLLSGFVDWGEEFAKISGGGGGGGPWYIQNGANSGVGRVVCQLGRLWGLRGIAVVRGREDKGEEEELKGEMRALGAEKVVTDKEVGEKGFKERVAEWTNGGREEVKLGLNCVGGDAAMGMAKVLGRGGTMVTYGAMSKAPMRVGASMLIFKDLRFLGFWVSQWADQHPEEKRKVVESILGLYREGKLVDSPSVDVKWDAETKREELVEAVQGTLEGYRKGKGMFVFGDT